MRLIRLLIGMVIVFVAVLAAGLFLLPGDRIAQLAADELSRRTGRAVTVGGDAHISFWPELGVTVDALSIANADWSENGPMFQAKSVTIGVDARGLINRDIHIRALRADAPQILLERRKDGTPNWELSLSSPAPSQTAQPEASAPAASTTPTAFTLDRAEITGASIFYIDRQSGTEITQRDIDLVLTFPDVKGPADIDLTLRPVGQPIRLTGEIADPMALVATKISTLHLNIEAPGGTASFDGRASLKPEAQGDLVLDLSDTARFAAALGRPDPALPAGLGRDARVSGQITYTSDGRLSLRQGAFRSGPNAGTIAADVVTTGDRPRINAQISAEALDLTALNSGGSPAPAETGWSPAPIDASALGLADAEISLVAPSIDLGLTKLGTTRLVLTVDRARAVATIREVQAFGGTLSGELVANNRNGLSVAGDLTAQSIALKNALTDLAGITRFTGEAGAKLKFLGAGQTLAAIMSSLSGEGSINTGSGTIEGIDLDRMFRTGDVSGGTTIFDSTALSYSIAQGVVSNSDLLMKLAGIEARGEGRIDLGQQSLDYLFTPVSLKARDGRGIAIPVRIRGAWASPKISLDVEKAIQLNAAEEKKQLEEKVKQKVKDEVSEKLGITQQEGETAEDAVKRTIGEEAAKGLLKLFNK
ncbi:AsmA family protein [Pseudooceanicola sp. C21-150M6]|uniref:AsmA family protein n=1 Tax=Pseudooceanicola sp. C21-150M6 TaxID=3434355 RepID=UPI003D7FBA95